MDAWSAHHLYLGAVKSLGEERALDVRRYALSLKKSKLPVIFSIAHLAKITNVDYWDLRLTAERKREAANYKMFAVKKRSGGRRFIHSVSGSLFRVQQYINSEILQSVTPHPASFAFHSQGGIRNCAAQHCGAKWIFQYDLENFFYDVTEADVFSIFHDLGYRPLLSFEMARICTTTRLPSHLSDLRVHSPTGNEKYPYADRHRILGVLPQGAPTSPMLSNLAARQLDEKLSSFAEENGFVYTRYADDIAISTTHLTSSLSIAKVNRAVIGAVRTSGFKENKNKMRVAGPGSRKVVLGLLVDGDAPRISRQMYGRIDRHLHASRKYGIVETAKHEGFDSAFGFHNHLSGLISFVKDVDTSRWTDFNKRLLEIRDIWGHQHLG